MLRFGEQRRVPRARRNAAVRRLRSQLELLEDRRLPATLFVNAGNTSADPNGSQANPYPQIQLALDHAQAGDTVDVAAGTYAESLVITQPVTLNGPNSGINPNTGSRGPEAVIIPPSDSSNTGIAILVEASGVTIDGLTLDGHNAAITSGTVLNGVVSNAHSGISNVDDNGTAQPIDDLTVQNDVIRNFTQFGVLGDAQNYNGANFVSTGNVIENNAIDNMPTVASSPIGNPTQGRGISIEDSFYAQVSGNVITRAATGIQAIYDLSAPNPAGDASSIANNQVQAYDRGILVYTADNGGQAVTLTGNSIAPDPTAGPTATGIGIDVERVLAGTNVSLSGNNVSGFPVGVQLGYSPAAGGISVTGGTLSGNTVGLVLTNASPPAGTTNLQPVAATLNGVTIQNSATAGIEVVDALGQAGTTVTLTTGPGTTVIGAAEGAALSGAGAKLLATAAPTVAFTQAPPAQTTSTSATFAFSGSDSVSSAGDLQYAYQLNNSGPWVQTTSPLTLNSLTPGNYTLTVQVTDQGKLTGTATTNWQVQAPTPTPPPPVLAPGSASSANTANTTTPQFTGNVGSGLTVQVFANNTLVGTTTADSSGNWSFTVGGAGSTVASLPNGSYAMTIATVDSAGVASAQSAPVQITVGVQAHTSTPQITVSTVTLPAFIFGIPKVPVVFTGNVSDAGSSVSTLAYSITNAAGHVVASGQVHVGRDGSYRILALVDTPAPGASAAQRTDTVTFTAVDHLGNTGTQSSTFMLAPTLDFGHHDGCGWDFFGPQIDVRH